MTLTVWLSRYKVLIVIVGVLIGVNILFLHVTPRELVEWIGVENSYEIVFVATAIGGLSTVMGAPIDLMIAVLAAGGASPLLLGLSGGFGFFISKSVFFLLVQYGRQSVPSDWHARLLRVNAWVATHIPYWIAVILAYLYFIFPPLPNDLLLVGLVIAGYTYRQVAPIILVGAFTNVFLVASVGSIIITYLLSLIQY